MSERPTFTNRQFVIEIHYIRLYEFLAVRGLCPEAVVLLHRQILPSLPAKLFSVIFHVFHAVRCRPSSFIYLFIYLFNFKPEIFYNSPHSKLFVLPLSCVNFSFLSVCEKGILNYITRDK
jgi:hypothetical protein